MAERTFSFRVISPLGTAFQGDARSVTLPTPDGEITILANHMPLVALLTDGELRIDTGEKVISVAVAGGFLETGGLVGEPDGTPGGTGAGAAPGGAGVGGAFAGTAGGLSAAPVGAPVVATPGEPAGAHPDRKWEATVLSDFAAESDSIEIARVEAAKARAEQLLQEKKERGDLLLVERDLQRAILQLKVAEKARSRRRGSSPTA
jgi:F0F1-type ATP synthase epsilon subunit